MQCGVTGSQEAISKLSLFQSETKYDALVHVQYIKIQHDSEALGTKLQIFCDSVVSHFPGET